MVEQGTKLHVLVEGLSSTNTYGEPSLIEDGTVAFSENMVSDNSGLVNRLGSTIFKNSDQWGNDVSVIAGKSYHLEGGVAELMVVLSDGRIYYLPVSSLPSDPTVEFAPSVTWTLLSTLSISDVNDVYVEVLNNLVYISDGSDMLKYYGPSHSLLVAPDPVGFEITMTVAGSTSAPIDSIYEDAADTSRQFNVEVTKSGGSGTTLVLRQISGTSRPSATGTLNKVSGAGTSNINWSAITFSESYEAMGLRDSRLVLVSSIGDIIISHPNRGYDFTSTQAERIPYGKVDGLRTTNVTDFKRGTILSLSRPQIKKYATAILTGYRTYDDNTPNITDGLFKVDRESKMIALLGRSGLEVGNGFIGLTRNGFINFAALAANTEFGITDSDYISNDIKNILRQVDWSLADNIRSCIDEANQRYWCAVPVKGATGNTLVIVYDFAGSYDALRNIGASRRWSLFTFSYEDATIESLFTWFGHPCMGLSDGTIVMAEIENYYYDNGEDYTSSIITKAHNFGVRSHLKSFNCGLVDLYLNKGDGSSAEMESYFIYDKNYQITNFSNKSTKIKHIHPIQVNTDDNWSESASDVWSLNPFDVWGNSLSGSYPLTMTNVPNFRELSICIKNKTGGYRWGIFGYEMWADVADKYFDSRPKNIVNTVNNQ